MTNFKVGDKVRMLRKERIEAADHTENGEIYEVVGTWGGGAILIDDKSGGASLLITKKELHAIEKVEPGTPKYRTVKREAIVGERILITNAHATGGYYSNSNVFTVERQCPIVPSLVYVVEHEKPIDRQEYEVILEETPPNRKTDDRISALEAEVETLKAQVHSLEKAGKPSVNVNYTVNLGHTAQEHAETLSETLRAMADASRVTPNYRRKAAIERAKAFVKGIERSVGRGSGVPAGNRSFNAYAVVVKYYVNTDKRAVTAIATYRHNGKLAGKAFAKCAPDDVFNADIGKAIAAGRLYGLDVSEFERAVQPTEVVVGMRVRGGRDRGYYRKSRTFTLIKTHRSGWAYSEDYPDSRNDWVIASDIGDILDDTEAQY